MLMSERAKYITVGTFLPKDEARAARHERLKKSEESAWYWNPEISDYIQEDPLYSEGVQTSELERMRFNDELAEKATDGTISWEEFGIQKNKTRAEESW